MELKPHQIAAHDMILNRLADGADSQLCALPTGTGKTFLAVALSRSFNRTLFCCHREELVRQTAEAFGLDTKIANYKGVRPISFYSWDLDCILDVLSMALNDEKEYPDKKNEGYTQLQELYMTLMKAYKDTYG